MLTKKHICTYFDFNYLSRGLALFYSIKKYQNDFNFYVLAFDNKTFEYLTNLKDDSIKLISIEEYNLYFKTDESKYEDKKQFYFSATPNICIYLIENFPDIDILLYLDADVALFSSLDPLYDEFGNSSIGFCPHRLHPFTKLYAKEYGKYNVGVNLFRNSIDGIACLKGWKKDCDEWYSGKPGYPLSFFSDQIFLDSWLNRYNGVKEIENIGVNVCHWNAINYKFSVNSGSYLINDKPLIIYHFSNLVKLNDFTWNANSMYSFVSIKGILLDLYKEYIFSIESFGLSNTILEKVSFKESIRKRLFRFFMRLFINELIINK